MKYHFYSRFGKAHGKLLKGERVHLHLRFHSFSFSQRFPQLSLIISERFLPLSLFVSTPSILFMYVALLCRFLLEMHIDHLCAYTFAKLFIHNRLGFNRRLLRFVHDCLVLYIHDRLGFNRQSFRFIYDHLAVPTRSLSCL